MPPEMQDDGEKSIEKYTNESSLAHNCTERLLEKEREKDGERGRAKERP